MRTVYADVKRLHRQTIAQVEPLLIDGQWGYAIADRTLVIKDTDGAVHYISTNEKLLEAVGDLLYVKEPVATASLLPSPAETGQLVFVVDEGSYYMFNGSSWTDMTGTAAGDSGEVQINTAGYLDTDPDFRYGSGKLFTPEIETTGDITSGGKIIADGSLLTDMTKDQVGLDQVDNTSDLDKPISTATQDALDLKEDKANKGEIGGYAELDGTGKVPASQLPSFVDDVAEYANLASFPATGESGKIYVTLDTNKTYRWSGTAYVEISASLALGETSSTAYRGDRGKIAYDHTLKTDNPHNVTKEQLGLGNVENVVASDTYLPLVGGTLTGLLNGVSASFTESVSAKYLSASTHISFSDASGNGIKTENTSGYPTFTPRIAETLKPSSALRFDNTNNRWESLSGFKATSIIKTGGTSSQFLKADGSVDSNTYLTTGGAAGAYLPLTGGTLSGPLTSSASGSFTTVSSTEGTLGTNGIGYLTLFNKESDGSTNQSRTYVSATNGPSSLGGAWSSWSSTADTSFPGYMRNYLGVGGKFTIYDSNGNERTSIDASGDLTTTGSGTYGVAIARTWPTSSVYAQFGHATPTNAYNGYMMSNNGVGLISTSSTGLVVREDGLTTKQVTLQSGNIIATGSGTFGGGIATTVDNLGPNVLYRDSVLNPALWVVKGVSGGDIQKWSNDTSDLNAGTVATMSNNGSLTCAGSGTFGNAKVGTSASFATWARFGHSSLDNGVSFGHMQESTGRLLSSHSTGQAWQIRENNDSSKQIEIQGGNLTATGSGTFGEKVTSKSVDYEALVVERSSAGGAAIEYKNDSGRLGRAGFGGNDQFYMHNESNVTMMTVTSTGDLTATGSGTFGGNVTALNLTATEAVTAKYLSASVHVNFSDSSGNGIKIETNGVYPTLTPRVSSTLLGASALRFDNTNNRWESLSGFRATSLVKSGSSDSYVLLGGGGTKAVSDFALASGGNYLPLSGGTLEANSSSAVLTVNQTGIGALLTLKKSGSTQFVVENTGTLNMFAGINTNGGIISTGANSSSFAGGGNINSSGGDITTSGGHISSYNGYMTTGNPIYLTLNTTYGWIPIDRTNRKGGGNVLSLGGHIFTSGGELFTDGGNITTSGGNITTSGGRINTVGGDVVTNGGDIFTNGGNLYAGESGAYIKTLRIHNLPTSSAGLIRGDVWRDGTTLKIVI